jgi:hypothetical protein
MIAGEMQKANVPDGGKRWNKGKPQWSLVHFPSLVMMVRVLEFGAQKYAADNWKSGLSVKQILESTIRHTAAMLDGEDIDPESGLPHYAHIQCNAMFLAYMMENRPEFDDRFRDPVRLAKAVIDHHQSKESKAYEHHTGAGLRVQ